MANFIIKSKTKNPNPEPKKHRIYYKNVTGDEPIIKNPRPQVVNKQGEPIKLSAYQKNSLYRQAKNLAPHIKDTHCTKNQCWTVNDHNVRRMGYEMSKSEKHKRWYFMKAMTALGADPKDCSVEKLRRRR